VDSFKFNFGLSVRELSKVIELGFHFHQHHGKGSR